MKTTFKTLLSAAILLTFTVGAGAATRSEPAAISRIKASGNVQVYISQGTTESIKVSGQYDTDHSLIAAEDGQLTIAAYSAEPVVVLVTVTNLESIEADGNAFVKTMNKLETDKLDVRLSDNAAALFDSEEEPITHEVSDTAALIFDGKN